MSSRAGRGGQGRQGWCEDPSGHGPSSAAEPRTRPPLPAPPSPSAGRVAAAAVPGVALPGEQGAASGAVLGMAAAQQPSHGAAAPPLHGAPQRPSGRSIPPHTLSAACGLAATTSAVARLSPSKPSMRMLSPGARPRSSRRAPRAPWRRCGPPCRSEPRACRCCRRRPGPRRPRPRPPPRSRPRAALTWAAAGRCWRRAWAWGSWCWCGQESRCGGSGVGRADTASARGTGLTRQGLSGPLRAPFGCHTTQSPPAHSAPQVPLDGEVVWGAAAVTAAHVSGEAAPVRAEPGLWLPAGAIATDGALVVGRLYSMYRSV
jgi:hypothetical protein